MDLRAVLAGVVVVGLLVGAIALIVRHKRHIREAFQGFAAARGLAFTGGSFPFVSGTHAGRKVYVGNELGRRPGDVVQFVVRVAVRGAVPAVFIAMPRRLLTGAGKVSTGDAGFDAAVRVDGDDAAAINAYLTPARRKAILELTALGGWVVGEQAAVLKGGPEVCWAQTGMTPKAEWLEARFAEVERFAPLLDA